MRFRGGLRANARLLAALVATTLVLSGCGGGGGASDESTPVEDDERRAVGVVIDSGSENDRGFNEYALKGAREAAEGQGLDFFFLTSGSEADYERHVESLVDRGADLVVTVGFRMGEATARAARRHTDVRFTIIDVEFAPGSGCAESVDDCYSEEGGTRQRHEPDVRRGPARLSRRHAGRVHDVDGHDRRRGRPRDPSGRALPRRLPPRCRCPASRRRGTGGLPAELQRPCVR